MFSTLPEVLAAACHKEPGRPWCICGAPLERLSSRERILRMLEDTDKEWRSRSRDNPDALIDRLLANSLVTCDLCEEDAVRSGAVWTCRSGPHTVLHPAAYDVCEHCFHEYSGRWREPQPAAATRAPPGGEARRASRCCHPCTSTMRSLLPDFLQRGSGAPPRGVPVAPPRIDNPLGARRSQFRQWVVT